MVYQGNLLSKTLVIGIILLLIGMSVVSSVAINTVNEPPEKPIITGPKEGVPNVKYNFTFLSFDPEGSNITYYVVWWETWLEWDDDKFGPYPSGTNITVKYAFIGRFSASIEAQSIDELGQKSDWAFWEIVIPRTRATIYSLIHLFFDRFPFLEVFLRAMNLLR